MSLLLPSSGTLWLGVFCYLFSLLCLVFKITILTITVDLVWKWSLWNQAGLAGSETWCLMASHLGPTLRNGVLWDLLSSSVFTAHFHLHISFSWSVSRKKVIISHWSMLCSLQRTSPWLPVCTLQRVWRCCLQLHLNGLVWRECPVPRHSHTLTFHSSESCPANQTSRWMVCVKFT